MTQNSNAGAPVTAIFFDPEGTIYFRPDRYAALKDFLRKHNLPSPPKPDVLDKLAVEEKQAAIIGKLSRHVYYKELLKQVGVVDMGLQAEGMIHIAQAQEKIVICPNVNETLSTLSTNDLKFGIITSTLSPTAEKLRWLKKGGVNYRWLAYACSIDVGARSPDPDLYLTAMEMADVSASETIYVGSEGLGLLGASRIGFKTIEIGKKPHYGANYWVSGFSDLLSIDIIEPSLDR